MTTIKYFLTATECREYRLDTGWEIADHNYDQSAEFETRDEALAFMDEFIAGLRVGKNEVFTIDLVEVNYPEDDDMLEFSPETIKVVDGSEGEPAPEYMLTRYFGTYMIPQDKYELCCPPRRLTRNEIMKRIENSSYQYHPVELFASEQEAREYVADLLPYLTYSVLEFDNQEV